MLMGLLRFWIGSNEVVMAPRVKSAAFRRKRRGGALHEPDPPRLPERQRTLLLAAARAGLSVGEGERTSDLVVDGAAGHDLDQHGHLGAHPRDALEDGQDVGVL